MDTNFQDDLQKVHDKEKENKTILDTVIEAITPITPAEPDEVSLDDLTVSDRVNDVYKEYRADAIEQFRLENGCFYFQCKNKITLKVEVLTEAIFRFRYAVSGKFGRDFSYAIDEQFSPAKVDAHFSYEGDAYIISTPKLICRIEKTGMKVTLSDKITGQVICADEEGFYAKWTILKGLKEVKITKACAEGEQYFGLGDKTCNLDLRGQRLENWCTDAFGYNDETNPLYRAIPFYYGLNQGDAYGIFFDNTYKTHFDFAKTNTAQTSFSAEGGEVNYYFIYGPELLDVARQYTDLTGRPELPPMWGLGFHQCRWSYYPESRVKEVANEFRERQIPCDALYLDIDYMNGYRCFTWDNNHFPDPTQMLADLKEQGFETVVMIDPGIKEEEGYHVYQQGIDQGLFCKRTNGEMMVGPVWPSECVFPDFTNPAARKWFGNLYHDLYVKNGVSGFWNDMNEPAVFKVNHKTFPDEVLHHYDGELTNHRKAHNIYGLQMSRSTYEGLKTLKPEKRPLVITRATYSGGQRYACSWTGDNVASWEHLRIANIQCQRMSVSGFSHIGTDIGGFVDRPTGELMVRWLQLGVFHPLFRVHSMGNNVDGAAETEKEEVEKQMAINRADQEPWSFGEEYTAHAKAAIELRYQLLAYLYTTYQKYAQDGTPILKSLTFYDQKDTATYGREKEFLFGDHLLISPVLQSLTDKASDEIYLPKGDWYNYWTGQKHTGQQEIEVPLTLDETPMFVKAGTVLPIYPIRQYTNERPVDVLTLKLYYKNGIENSPLYEDAGEGYAYENKEFSLKSFTLTGSDNSLILRQLKEGSFMDTYSTCKIEVYGLPFENVISKVDGQEIAAQWNETKTALSFSVNNSFNNIEMQAV